MSDSASMLVQQAGMDLSAMQGDAHLHVAESTPVKKFTELCAYMFEATGGVSVCTWPQWMCSRKPSGGMLQAELERQQERCEVLQESMLRLEQQQQQQQKQPQGSFWDPTEPQQSSGPPGIRPAELAAANSHLSRKIEELSDNLSRYELP